MEEQIKHLGTQVISLQQQIALLTEAVNKLSNTTERMDDHIDFVEQTYTTLRAPLDFIRNRFWGLGTSSLPTAPHQHLLDN